MLGKLYDFTVSIENKLFPKAETELTRRERNMIQGSNATSWRVATEEYDSEILSTLHSVQKKSGINRKSRLIIIENGHLNASYGYKTDGFCITQEAVNNLSKDELETIFGHEVGHQLQRNALIANDIGWMGVLLGISTWLTHLITPNKSNNISLASNASSKEKSFHMFEKVMASPLVVAGVFAASYKIFNKLLNPIYKYTRRLFEKDADKKSVLNIQKPQEQIDQLKKGREHKEQFYKEWDEKYDIPIAPTDHDKKHIILSKPSEHKKEITGWRKTLKESNRSHPSYEEREKIIRETAAKYNISM